MPLLVFSPDLQPGMRLAEAFMWKSRMMLPGGKVLDRHDVQILQTKYPELGFRIKDPVLDSLTDFEDDTRERKVALTATQKIAKAMTEVQERFAANTDPASFDFVAVRKAASGVMEYLRNNPVSAALLNRSVDPDCYLAEHAGNVFYLCMLLGTAVKDYVVRERTRQTAAQGLSHKIAMNLLPLGLGAMFMDLGMVPLKHVFKPDAVLTDQDRTNIREHPITGGNLLPEGMPTGVKMVVRTHHENFDGTGYPAKLKGESLHIFTRIIRICDAYDAATATKVYAAAKSPARAIWEMTLGPARHCYDPILAKVFVSLIQPFPIGAKIRLSDGRYGVVVRYNRKNPFFPTVIIAFDEQDRRLAKPVGPMELSPNEGLRIISFGSEHLGYLYDAAPPKLDMTKRVEFEDLLAAAYP